MIAHLSLTVLLSDELDQTEDQTILDHLVKLR